MGQHPSRTATTSPFPNYQVYPNQQAGPVQYVDVPVSYPDDPRDHRPGFPFPPPPLFVNNDFVQLPPRPMDYPGPSEPPYRGGYRRPPRGQRGPPPRREDCNPPPARRDRRRRDDMDEMSFFRDDDDDNDDEFLDMDFGDLKSTRQDRQGGFDPFVENPRLYTREQLEKGGARELIDNVRQRARQGVEPARQQNDQARPMPQRGNGRGGRQAPRNQPSNQNVAPQGQNPGPGYKFVPAPAGGAPQTMVIGYDPVTGAIHQPSGNQPLANAVLAYAQEAPSTMPSYQIISPASCYPQACNTAPQSYVIPAYM